MNKQFQQYIELLRDGFIIINDYRINNKNVEGIKMGQFMCKYIDTIKPVLVNTTSLVNMDNNLIYNLIAFIFKEIAICLYNHSEENTLAKNNLLEQMFRFSLLSMRIGSFSEIDLDELRKYQSYGVKLIGNDLLTYNGPHFNFNDEAEIIITMTTCKRFDLFEQTINSFLNCCLDKELISEFLVVDDNSSEEDRIKMKKLYPFITFIFKNENEKGHAKSMNIIRNYVIMKNYKYTLHLEDDWRFLFKDLLISKCKLVLDQNPNYGQCLFNKNYSEEDELYKYVGGKMKEINLQDKLNFNSIRYYEHEFYQGVELQNKMNESAGRNTCYYWANFSFRCGLTKVEVLKNVGEFNETTLHFEREYSYRYMNKGYITTYLDTLFCRHLGRKTWEINDKKAVNAYTLNGTNQFENDINRENKILETKNKENDKGELQNELIKMIKDIQQGNTPNNNFTNILINTIKNQLKENKNEICEVIDLSENQEIKHENTNIINQEIKHNIDDVVNMENSKVKDKAYKLKTYVINLERRKDRLEKFIEKNSKELKSLNYEVFKAVDGKSLKPTHKLLKLFETSDYTYRKGIVGCACSHILLWLELVKSKEFDTLLILEDDSELAPNFMEKLQNVLQQAPFIGDKPVWDIIYLGNFVYPQYNDSRTKLTTDNTIKLELYDRDQAIKENLGGTFGYLITRKGAENILEQIQNYSVYNGIDWVMFKSALKSKYIKSLEDVKGRTFTYYCSPMVVSSFNDNSGNSNIDSDIQKDFSSLYVDLKTRLKKEIIYWNVINGIPGYKCISTEKKIEGLNYNEKSNIIYTETLPKRTELLTNITIIPFNRYEDKMELIKSIKIYPLTYYTIEDLHITRIVDPEIDIPKCPVNGYFFSIPETKLNDKVKNDISFEYYLNTTFSVEYQ